MPELRRRRSNPGPGHHVWLRSRYDMNIQPNGYITKIDWEDKEVHMRFYCDLCHGRKCSHKRGTETLPLEDFIEAATWTDKFGGMYFPEGD